MKKRKYDGLVPDLFKELVRNALQQPDTATESKSRQQALITGIKAASSSGHSAAEAATFPVESFPSDVRTIKRFTLPNIPSTSFYSAKDRAASSPPGVDADSNANGARDGLAAHSIARTEPEYLRLIQLYKNRCSLFAAERRQHCFQMFAKLKEALAYASLQSKCHVFAQEGAYFPLAFS
jgi:hypothetical protein